MIGNFGKKKEVFCAKMAGDFLSGERKISLPAVEGATGRAEPARSSRELSSAA